MPKELKDIRCLQADCSNRTTFDDEKILPPIPTPQPRTEEEREGMKKVTQFILNLVNENEFEGFDAPVLPTVTDVNVSFKVTTEEDGEEYLVTISKP